MKTSPCNDHPLTPHFYIVKLGLTGVYMFFLIFAIKHILWVLVRTASMRRFKRVPTIYVLSKNMKIVKIFQPKIRHFYSSEKSLYIAWACFRYELFLLIGGGALKPQQNPLMQLLKKNSYLI